MSGSRTKGRNKSGGHCHGHVNVDFCHDICIVCGLEKAVCKLVGLLLRSPNKFVGTRRDFIIGAREKCVGSNIFIFIFGQGKLMHTNPYYSWLIRKTSGFRETAHTSQFTALKLFICFQLTYELINKTRSPPFMLSRNET